METTIEREVIERAYQSNLERLNEAISKLATTLPTFMSSENYFYTDKFVEIIKATNILMKTKLSWSERLNELRKDEKELAEAQKNGTDKKVIRIIEKRIRTKDKLISTYSSNIKFMQIDLIKLITEL